MRSMLLDSATDGFVQLRNRERRLAFDASVVVDPLLEFASPRQVFVTSKRGRDRGAAVLRAEIQGSPQLGIGRFRAAFPLHAIRAERLFLLPRARRGLL